MSLYAVRRPVVGGQVYVPLLACDHCDDPITDNPSAYVAFRTDQAVAAAIFFVHQWCLPEFCAEHGGRQHWQALLMKEYLAHLTLEGIGIVSPLDAQESVP